MDASPLHLAAPSLPQAPCGVIEGFLPMKLPDLTAVDHEDQPVLFIDVFVKPWREINVEPRLGRMHPTGSFLFDSDVRHGMIVNSEAITLYDLHAPTPTVLGTLATMPVLTVYTTMLPDALKRPLGSEEFLRNMVEARIRDFNHHWKSEEPPGSDLLEPLGLSQRLWRGWVQESKISFGPNPVY